jgi:acetylornithine/succinyldiaminopimelate/putrescine aminotransferase
MANIRNYFFKTTLLLLLFISTPAYADLGKVAPYKDPDNQKIIDTIQNVGLIQETQKELYEILEKYQTDKKGCMQLANTTNQKNCIDTLFPLLERAKALLKRLNSQAESVEAEIALYKKQLQGKYIKKLDRILTEVSIIRKLAAADFRKNTL